MENIVKLYQSIPNEVWVALLGGIGTTAFAQLVKVAAGLTNKAVIKLMVATTAVLLAFLQWLISTHAIPGSVLGSHAAVFYTAAEMLYLLSTRVISPFLNGVQNYKDRKDRVASDQAVAAVIVPATLAPVTADQNANIVDF